MAGCRQIVLQGKTNTYTMQRFSNTAFFLSLFTGLCLLFIGSRFLLHPLAGETGFGIHVPVNGQYAFHYIKGIRDLFTGLAITVLLLLKEHRALGWVLLLGSIVPLADFLVVLSQPVYNTTRLYPHLTALVLALVLGSYYIFFHRKK